MRTSVKARCNVLEPVFMTDVFASPDRCQLTLKKKS